MSGSVQVQCACPFCARSVVVTIGGRDSVAHAMPTCAAFEEMQPEDYCTEVAARLADGTQVNSPRGLS